MLRTLVVTALLAAPLAARADDFDITVSAYGLDTTATLTGTSNGDGSYTITGVPSSIIAATVVQNDTLFGGDNLFYPTEARLFDVDGLTVSTIFGTANIFSTVSGYEIQGYDSSNDYFDIPDVSIALTPSSVTPEPSALVLSFTGLLASAGLCFRKRFAAVLPQPTL